MKNVKNLNYDIDAILGAFSLTRSIEPCSALEVLMQKKVTLPVHKAQFLEEKRYLLAVEGEFWNEEELKMQFLAHLFDVVQMNVPSKIKTFYERPMTATIGQHKLFVLCDMFLAKPYGINTPQTPYFFLQEFKKAKKAEDAEGQMLIAMLIAQHQNKNGKPVYGCWLQGKNWVFTALHGQHYCVSRQYDATDKVGLSEIVNLLNGLKDNILQSLL